MEPAKNHDSFKDHVIKMEKKLYFEIDGKKYLMKKFSLRTDSDLRAEFKGMDMSEEWAERFKDADPLIIGRTMFALMAPTPDFKNSDEFIDKVQSGLEAKEKMALMISEIIIPSLPITEEETEKGDSSNVKKLKRKIQKKNGMK